MLTRLTLTWPWYPRQYLAGSPALCYTCANTSTRHPRSTRGPLMDEEQRNHLEGLRRAHLRRLRILEQQAAFSGANTRPEVLTEIEDLQVSIAQINAQLAAAAEAPSAPAAAPA